MNAAQLLAHFDRISEAPDAVARLRQFVLQLAVCGKLVAQDSSDQSFRQLLNVGAVVSTPDLPYPIPATWAWVRLGDVSKCRLGKMLDKGKNRGTPRRYLRNVNVRWYDFDLSNVLEMRFEDSELDEFALRRGDVLICEGGEPGRAAVWDERETDIYFQKAIHRVRFSSIVDPDYFVGVLRESAQNGRIKAYFTGVTIKHLTGKGLSSFLLPVPPLAEQHRIVARVNESMALCDRLEAAHAEREHGRNRLVAASARRMTQPDADTNTFRKHARFHLSHFAVFTSRIADVRQLRQTILILGICGRLVPQDPADQPVEDFEIVSDEAVPFQIPASWRWTPLRSLGRLTGGGTPSKSRSEYWDGTIPWVSPKDMKQELLNDAVLHITSDAVAGSAVNIIKPHSILFVVRGMILAHSFPVAINEVPVTVNQDMKSLVLRKPEMAFYLLRVLQGMKLRILAKVKRSSHGTCRLEGPEYAELPIPVPPVAEQRRIVARIHELMELCNSLEAEITASDTRKRQLLETMLYRAVDGNSRDTELQDLVGQFA